MRLEPLEPEGMVPLDAYGDGGFRAENIRYEGAIMLSRAGISCWDATTLDALTFADFKPFMELNPVPEFIVLGVGPVFRAPPAGLAKKLLDAGVGLEFMDTGAASRLYNLLGSEGRNFAAALLPVA